MAVMTAPPRGDDQVEEAGRGSRIVNSIDTIMSDRVLERVISWGSLILMGTIVGFSAGWLTGVAVIALLLGLRGLKFAADRFPQATGSAVSSFTIAAFAVAMATVMGPTFMAAGSIEMGAGFLLAPLAPVLTAWIAPHHGVHRGWSSFLGHLPVWAAMGATVVFPQHSAALAFFSSMLGVIVVLARMRRSPHRVGDERSVKRRVVRGGAMSLAVMISALMLSMTGPAQEAKALDLTFGLGDKMLCSIVSPSPNPQPVGTGPEAVIPSYNMTGLSAADGTTAAHLNQELEWPSNLDNYTLYELSGLRGLRFVNWVKDNEGENTHCLFQAWTSVTSGNAINTIGLFVLQLTIFLKEFAQVQDPFRDFYEPFTPAVNVFLSTAFSLFGVAYILGLIVAMARAWRGGTLSSVTGNMTGALLTAFIAAVAYGGLAAGAAWSSPQGNGFYTVMSFLDQTAASVNAGISNEVLSQLPQTETAMCAKPSGGSAVDDGQRYSSCLLAETLAYKPWAVATFGPAGAAPITPSAAPVDGGSAQANPDAEGATALPCYNSYQGCGDLRTYLLAQVGGPDISNRLGQCLSSNGYDPEAGEVDNHAALAACEPYHAVASDLMAKADTGGSNTEGAATSMSMASYRGDTGGSTHTTQALSSLVGIVTVGFGISVIAAATIYWHGRLLLLFILGPLILAHAAFRGADHATKWVGDVIQTVVVRVIYGLLTTLLIFVVGLVAVMDVPTGVQLIIMAIMIFSMLKLVSKADEASRIAGGSDAGAGQVLSRHNVITGSAIGTVAGNAITGVGKAGTVGVAKVAGKGAQVAGRGVGKTTEFGTRPVRQAGARAAGRADAYRGAIQGTAAAAAGGTASGVASGTASATGAAAGAAVGGAAGAAAGMTGAAAMRAAANPGRGSAPEAGRGGQATDDGRREQAAPEKGRGVLRGAQDRMRRVGGAISTAYTAPDGSERAQAQSREELFMQRKNESFESAWDEGVDVPSIRERRNMRREIRGLSDDSLVNQNRNLTADEQAARLAQIRREDRTDKEQGRERRSDRQPRQGGRSQQSDRPRRGNPRQNNPRT